LRELDILRVSALLRDIGKIECWAYGKPWGEHIYYTYRFFEESSWGRDCGDFYETSYR